VTKIDYNEIVQITHELDKISKVANGDLESLFFFKGSLNKNG